MTEKEQKKREKDRRANRTILWRSIFLMAVFGVGVFIPLLWQLWQIQIVDHEHYQELAIGQQTRDLAVSAERGTIYDAKGEILAISATVHNVVLSPKDVVALQKKYAEAVEAAQAGKGEYPDYPEPSNERIAAGLSTILGVEESAILERLAKTDRQYELVKTKLEEETAQQVRAFITEGHLAPGVFLEPDTKRYYPQSTLACHVLGFVNDTGGVYGLEAEYDEELSGEAGRVVTAKDARGTEMLSRYESYIDAVNGYDMTLALDATVQGMLETVLAEGIETFDVQYGGFAIAMDPNTGAILGMASSPEYDLNDYSVIADPDRAEQVAQLQLSAAETAYLSALREAAGEDGTGLSAEQTQSLHQLEQRQQIYAEALRDARDEQWLNKVLKEPYEPGSTFKSLVLAAALEEGAVKESDTFYCPGFVEVADWKINCHKHEGHGSQTLAEAVENSCNPAFVAIGQRLGAEKFYDYLERYGMIGKTGIDLPYETSNDNGVLVWPRSSFTSAQGLTSLAVASFGQRFQVTPIQLICGVASVINGGHLLEPYVVETIRDADGNAVYQHQVTEVRQVISESTSATVRTILEGVVDGGTGKNAYMAGYRIGGKTGTSQTLSEDDHNIVSFVGFAPADDPQVIVLLGYDGPKATTVGGSTTAGGWYISGGQMAARMAGPLIAEIADYLGVQKQYAPDELADTMVPNLVGKSVAQAQDALTQAGLTWRTVGEGEAVTGQIPAQGATIPGNSQVVLYLGGSAVPEDQVEMPNVQGLTPQEVQDALARSELFLRATGAVEYFSASNAAVSQSVEAGTMVDRGTVIEVHFVDSSVRDDTGDIID